jgi:outer membrane protein assembly factor BamA
MSRSLGRALCALVCLGFAPAVCAQDAPVRAILITGAKELSQETIRRAIPAEVGAPLTQTPERIAEAVQKRYHDEEYTFARADVTFDEATGTLSVKIDEGVIDQVEFQGVDDPDLARRFTEEFALRGGDVFNRKNAMQALEVLLRQTRGAIRPGHLYSRDASDLRNRRGTFDLVDRGGQRVLLVGLREPAGRFRMTADLGAREDWFTSVDGFVPSLGFNAAVFDHSSFNHAYVQGHLSFKTASERVGYALGFERPVFRTRKLYLGGELYDLTASDDQWQVSSTEASLAAIGPRKTFRDYYRRRGLQIGTAFRIHPQAELFFAWRGERKRLQFLERRRPAATKPAGQRGAAERARYRRLRGRRQLRSRIAGQHVRTASPRSAVWRAPRIRCRETRRDAGVAYRLDVRNLDAGRVAK